AVARSNYALGCRWRLQKKWGPARFAAKPKPHRPGIAPALGLRPGEGVSSLYRGPCKGANHKSSKTSKPCPRSEVTASSNVAGGRGGETPGGDAASRAGAPQTEASAGFSGASRGAK